jgi:hypothetical protein
LLEKDLVESHSICLISEPISAIVRSERLEDGLHSGHDHTTGMAKKIGLIDLRLDSKRAEERFHARMERFTG